MGEEMMEHFGWTEKYRPHTVAECVLPAPIKEKFQAFVNVKNMPNLILTGPSGLGKTSVALATLDEIGCDYIKINAKLKRGIDVIRDEMMQFATTMSFTEGRKFIVLDEADGMLSDAQGALNAFIEEYESNCGFIFTCNNINKIIPAIKSRCDTIDFKLTKYDYNDLAPQFYKSLRDILDTEGVPYEKPVLADVIKRHYPDWRHTLVFLQSYAVKAKKIDTGILAQRDVNILLDLVPIMRGKKWTDMRKWIGENFASLPEVTSLARDLLKEIEPELEGKSVAIYIDLANEYDYRAQIVVDKEINMVAFLTKVMSEMIWK
jgi:replication-associated recombination protein RarA